MRIVRGVKNYSEKLPNPVLTLGNFDGVHLGHQAIFRRVVDRAAEIGGTSIAFTFEPHPLKVLAPERSPKLLNTFHGKMELFEAAGIEVVICANFTREFADQNPEDFARDVLHKKIGVREVYVGYDYAFGKGREGSIESLKVMGKTHGFRVGVVDAVQVDGTVVSSSIIRDLISTGRVTEAVPFLGRRYTIEGEVVHGSHRGHSLGFPTANLRISNELLPAYGVYAVLATVDGLRLKGVASIGVRPTFDTGSVSVEVYLFDYAGDLYGKQITVSFVKRLRGEEKFPSAESLVRQIRKDVQEAELVLQGL
ncbi:MAG TPA: bifunctional riboflavin kinase/FAD synthetase [Nitrospirota bacterium]|nr:bifunctional riboflavin kinase/FAD synthetase [Nitrospirota bacterium]